MEKPSLIVRFFSFLLKVAVVLVLMVAIAFASFEGVNYYLTGSFYDVRKLAGDGGNITSTGSSEIQEPEIDETNMRSTLFFVDSADSGREYIALNMLNTRTHILDILLIPANAQVTVGKELLDDLQKEMPEAKNTVNLTDVARAFGEDRYDMISDIMENVTGLTLSGYDVMTQENFESFLDMVNDVPYQVDEDISYRNANGVLRVIEGGQTEIDSQDAIALLTYLDGTETEESNRLERTNVYLQSFFQTLFAENDSSTIYRKYTNLVQTGGGRDLSGEEENFNALSPENITIRILQGAEADNVFTIDSQMVQLQVSTLAQQAENTASDGSREAENDNSGDDSSETGSAIGTDSKDYSIELYNSAYVAGLAGEWESYLEGEGYSISLVDSYQDEGPLSTTRIVVTEEGMGEDLLTYFPSAEIEVGDIDTGGDIQVYIGTDSTDVGGEDSTYDGDTSDDETDADETDSDYSYDGEDSSYDNDESDGSSYDDENSDDDSSYDDGEDTDDEEGESSQDIGGYGGSYNFDTDSAQ